IPSGDVTGAVDTVAIQGALTAAASGSTVQLANGVFYTSAPLTVPPGVELAGSHGSKHVTAGTTINLTSGFAGAAAIILGGGTGRTASRSAPGTSAGRSTGPLTACSPRAAPTSPSTTGGRSPAPGRLAPGPAGVSSSAAPPTATATPG